MTKEKRIIPRYYKIISLAFVLVFGCIVLILNSIEAYAFAVTGNAGAAVFTAIFNALYTWFCCVIPAVIIKQSL